MLVRDIWTCIGPFAAGEAAYSLREKQWSFKETLVEEPGKLEGQWWDSVKQYCFEEKEDEQTQFIVSILEWM